MAGSWRLTTTPEETLVDYTDDTTRKSWHCGSTHEVEEAIRVGHGRSAAGRLRGD